MMMKMTMKTKFKASDEVRVKNDSFFDNAKGTVVTYHPAEMADGTPTVNYMVVFHTVQLWFREEELELIHGDC